ncbi:hypothetical protein POJ06DRAFT_106647 [Lipomyces tetrasporus]|uniref:SET domain-containing protein n=1 Tax=Lipomyces tetrasporus TaxID=54092 RepID=A0AAD7QSL4_9ASCO|nr:uncharacterized protein POJ06DRAFT_106647 [Lipomyces tetrasporus]KAJ8100546.1 hypothetical protein POJ06DRAFT_106647 [Lipomyces tetrasporus]
MALSDPSLLLSWAKLQDIDIHKSIQIKSTPQAGLGIFYSGSDPLVTSEDEEPSTLMSVPKKVILTAENIRTFALSYGTTLQELLKSGDEEETLSQRATILRFLLFSLHQFEAPKLQKIARASNCYAAYLDFMPSPLSRQSDDAQKLLTALSLSDSLPPPPTFWTPGQISKTVGTSLYSPLAAKVRLLSSEFEQFSSQWQDVFEKIDGACENDVEISFEEYVRADWLVASRLMELPMGDELNIGIIPLIDFANHSTPCHINAQYEITDDAVKLVSLPGRVAPDDELLISYGPSKGSSEILFTYGFLIDSEDAGRESVKMRVRDGGVLQLVYGRPPVAEFVVSDGEVTWECEFLWLLCVTEEDGFEVSVAQQVEGPPDVDISIRGRMLSGVRGQEAVEAMKEEYGNDGKMRDVLELRRVLILERWVSGWMEDLARAEIREFDEEDQHITELAEDDTKGGGTEKDMVDGVIETLRQREERVYLLVLQELEKSKQKLAKSEAVMAYLAAQNEEPEGEDEQTPELTEADELR